MHDEDDEREEMLKRLGGEVDDYAGSQLKDPSEPEGKQGVTIEISVKPHGAEGEEPEDQEEEKEEHKPEEMEAGNEEHDPIAHILGMCGGGCTK